MTTPRTDAHQQAMESEDFDVEIAKTYTFARQLESELNEAKSNNTATCSACRWSMPLDDRYDQVRCTNEASDDAWGEVESTHTCTFFKV